MTRTVQLLLAALLICSGLACARGGDVRGNAIFTLTVNATIANAQQLSGSVDIQDYCIVGWLIPATLTGTAITLQCSPDDVTFKAVRDSANAVITYNITDDTYHDLTQGSPGPSCGCRFIKLDTGAAEGAARTIPLTLGR